MFVGNVNPGAVFSDGTSLVRVTGGGFQVPPIPWTFQPVGVLVGTLASPKVLVQSTGRLFFEVPRVSLVDATGRPTGSQSFDVTIQNLDQAGNVIEDVVVPGALTVQRPDYSDARSSNLGKLTNVLLDLFRSQVLANTSTSTHVDYAEDAFKDPRTLYVADPPGISLTGPSFVEDPEYENGLSPYCPDSEAGQQAGTIRGRPPVRARVSFEVVLVDNHYGRFLRLIESATRFVEANPRILVDNVAYEMDVVDRSGFRAVRQTSSRPANSSIHVAKGTIEVRGFPLYRHPGLPNQAFGDWSEDVSAAIDDVGVDPATELGQDLPS